MSKQEAKDDKTVNSSINLPAQAKEPGFWREMWQQIRLVWYLVRDPEVPVYLKILPFLGLIYLIIPVDLVPDLAPVLGQLDDMTALLISSKVFIELAPPHIVAQHMTAIRQQDGYESAATADPSESADESIVDAIIIDGDHEIVEKPGDTA